MAGSNSTLLAEAISESLLGSELVVEQFITDDEERIEPEDTVVDGELCEGGVLEELAGVFRVKRAIKIVSRS